LLRIARSLVPGHGRTLESASYAQLGGRLPATNRCVDFGLSAPYPTLVGVRRRGRTRRGKPSQMMLPIGITRTCGRRWPKSSITGRCLGDAVREATKPSAAPGGRATVVANDRSKDSVVASI
jgi:hypothetical protein